MAAWSPVASTKDTRSGDRVRNGMVIGGLSVTGISIMLDPYITALMGHQTAAYGIQFADPDGWKDALIQILVMLATAIWGTLHMRFIRAADNEGTVTDELKFADDELGRLRAELAELKRLREQGDA